MFLTPKICVGKDVENLEPKHFEPERKPFKLYTHSFLLVLIKYTPVPHNHTREFTALFGEVLSTPPSPLSFLFPSTELTKSNVKWLSMTVQLQRG